jgi:hypothetical protein
MFLAIFQARRHLRDLQVAAAGQEDLFFQGQFGRVSGQLRHQARGYLQAQGRGFLPAIDEVFQFEGQGLAAGRHGFHGQLGLALVDVQQLA